MIGTYTITDYKPAFKDQIVNLQRQLWSRDLSLNRAYFEWKYERNPYLPDPIVAVALDGGRVVGMRGLFGTCWEAGLTHAPVVLPCADDYVIDTNHRGSGLAVQIMERAHALVERAGFAYLINTSAGRVATLQSLAMGWRGTAPMNPVGRGKALLPPPRRRRLIEKVRRRVLRSRASLANADAPLFAALDRAAAPADSDGRTGNPVEISRTPKPEAMAQLVDRLGYDGRIRHRRDAVYFAWRFQNPLREYRFLFVGRERLEGYLVLQRMVASPLSGRVSLVDWEAADDRTLHALLQVAADRVPELYAWEAAMPAAQRALLAEIGFAPADLETRARGVPCVLVRHSRLHGREADWTLGAHRILDPKAWDMRLLYSMAG